MNFYLDHDVPDHLGNLLERHGHGVERVRNTLSPQSEDSAVLQYAVRQKAVLLTCNRDDFLRLAQKIDHSGIIIIIRRPQAISEAGHLLSLLAKAGEKGLQGNINFA